MSALPGKVFLQKEDEIAAAVERAKGPYR